MPNTTSPTVTSAQPTTPPSGTIDITNLVASLKDTWIRWAVNLVVTSASSTPYTFWLKWPVINTLFEMLIKLVVTKIADGLEMGGFFLNTAIRKASQAQDYIAAKGALDALPPTASNAEYAALEQREMVAFRNFVMVTN